MSTFAYFTEDIFQKTVGLSSSQLVYFSAVLVLNPLGGTSCYAVLPKNTPLNLKIS